MAARDLPLRALHEARGAAFAEVASFRLPNHYGDARAELQRLQESCGVADLSDRSRLELVGDDRARFLQGQITCDVLALEEGEGTFGFMTNGKGRVMATAVVRALADRLWLELPAGRARPIKEHLEKYIVMDRVEVRRLDELLPIAIVGESASPTIATLAVDTASDVLATPWAHRRVTLGGTQVHLGRHERLGAPAYVAWISEGIADLVVSGWLEDTDLELVGHEALESQRIAAGVASWGRDFDDANLPQESGIEGAIDWEKGCYLGQEVVARLHYRGQAARQLRRLEFEEEVAASLLVGAELLLDDRPAGSLTSLASRSTEGRVPALAMLQRRALEPGTVLRTGCGTEVAVLGGMT